MIEASKETETERERERERERRTIRGKRIAKSWLPRQWKPGFKIETHQQRIGDGFWLSEKKTQTEKQLGEWTRDEKEEKGLLGRKRDDFKTAVEH